MMTDNAQNPPQPTSDPHKIMKALRGHLKQRENVRKQIRRKRDMLFHKENFDYKMEESHISSGQEKASFRRIDAAQKCLDYVDFPEDADERGAERDMEQDELGDNASYMDDLEEEDYDDDDDDDNDGDDDDDDEGEEGDLFMEEDWDYEGPAGGEVEA